METTFTPGPYTTYQRSDNGYNLYAGETMIADVDAAQFSRQKQVHHRMNKANAALLSAAPDLYEALGKAEAALSVKYSELSEEGRNLIFEIRTALAKARGEEE